MEAFDELLQVMDKLLGEDGCPWDREQTHQTLREYLLEESYEAADAVDKGDMDALKEELGDVLLQVVFHAKLAEREGFFNITDVAKGISQKLINRHTHIFGEDKAADASDVLRVWEKNKRKEKAQDMTADAMAAVPAAMPALMRAAKVWKRADKSVREAVTTDSVTAEITNLLSKVSREPESIGEILLKLVMLAEILEINAEYSLTNTIEAFINSDRKNL